MRESLIEKAKNIGKENELRTGLPDASLYSSPLYAAHDAPSVPPPWRGRPLFCLCERGKRLAGNRIAIHRDILPSVPSQISSALVAGTHSLEKSLPQIPAHQARRYEFPVQRGRNKKQGTEVSCWGGGMFCCCCPLAGQCIPRWRAALRVHLPRLAGSPSPGPLFNFSSAIHQPPFRESCAILRDESL